MAYAESYFQADAPLLGFDPDFPFAERIRPLVLAKNTGSALKRLRRRLGRPVLWTGY